MSIDPRDDDDDLIPERPLRELDDRSILILMCERQAVANRRFNALHEKVVKHEDRIGNLESWRTFLAGAWAAVTLIGAVAGKWAWDQVTRGRG